MHKQGFVHRDLKPENICLENNLEVKIIDFGTARKFTAGKKLKQVIGTPFYMAPEIFVDKKYNEKADLWSLGIVMYILLTGKAPYFGSEDEKIIAQAKKGQYNKQLLHESKVSRPAITLIEQLLNVNHKRRISAEEALANPWIQKHIQTELSQQDIRVQQSLLNNLKNFNARMKLQQAVITLMIHQLISPQEMEDQKRLFTRLDYNYDGVLDRDELIVGFRAIFGQVNENEVDEIMADVDLNGNGQIEYSEWLVATTKREHLLNEQKLRQAFRYFNKAGNGRISLLELKEVMGGGMNPGEGSNANLDEQVYRDIMAEVNGEGIDGIDFSKFKSMMKMLVGSEQKQPLRNVNEAAAQNFLPYRQLPNGKEKSYQIS